MRVVFTRRFLTDSKSFEALWWVEQSTEFTNCRLTDQYQQVRRMAQGLEPMTDKEIEEFKETMDEQTEELCEALAEDPATGKGQSPTAANNRLRRLIA